MDRRGVLHALHGAKHCLTHDVDKGTVEFTVRQIQIQIDKLEEEEDKELSDVQ